MDIVIMKPCIHQMDIIQVRYLDKHELDMLLQRLHKTYPNIEPSQHHRFEMVRIDCMKIHIDHRSIILHRR